MGGGDRGNDRDIRRIVPGGILDSVREVERMPEYDFEDLYDQIRDTISAYMDPGGRIAYITGYLRGMDPDTALTAGQVRQILALRYPEEKE